MRNALIGYTGFVGENLKRQMFFDDYYNSQNISDIIDKEYDLLICAGVRAEKYLANINPENDIKQIMDLFNILIKVQAKKFVLISTIDVYNCIDNVNENFQIDENKLSPYGKHRFLFENMIKKQFENVTIIRLPGLFGKGLKKNFIFDLMDQIPSMLSFELYNNICKEASFHEVQILSSFYLKTDRCYLRDNSVNLKQEVKKIFIKNNFSSVKFTDSRSVFQFYNLENISKDIDIAINNNLRVVNFASYPISINELCNYCFNDDFKNIIDDNKIVKYNMKSIHSSIWGSIDGYIYGKFEVLNDIKSFILNNIDKY